jgi:hypothetical protein
MPTLTGKQGDELTKEISTMLVGELESGSVKKKVDKLVANYVKKNKIEIKPEELSKNIQWSVKVTLKE